MQDVAGIGIAASSRKVTESRSSGQLGCSADTKPPKKSFMILHCIFTNLSPFGVTLKSRHTSDSAGHPVPRAVQQASTSKRVTPLSLAKARIRLA